MSTPTVITEQFLLPHPPRPAKKLVSWVENNLQEVVDSIRSLYVEDSWHMVNEQLTLSLLEDKDFKVELCLALLKYNESYIPKKWAKVKQEYPELARDFFPGGFKDYFEASRCNYLDPEVQKSHTQKVLLRLKTVHEGEFVKSKTTEQIKLWVFEDAPELGNPRFLPRVTRRLQNKAITKEMLKASQTMSNVAFGWNKYSNQILEAFKASPLAKEKKWMDWLIQAADEIQAVKSWSQFFCVWMRWEWRMRAMVVTRDRLNIQGNKLSRVLFRFAVAVEIEDEAWPSLMYSLKKRGVTEDNYLTVLEKGITCKSDIETYAAACDLLELKETGKSSALWGLDQVASLMRLIVAYLGDARGYRDVGLHLIGCPWNGTEPPDVWHDICRDVILRDPEVSSVYDLNSHTMKLARTVAKRIGTRHGFGAAALTSAFGLLGLDKDRDESRLSSCEGLENVLDHIEWPEIYSHIPQDNWVPQQHMDAAKEKSELVIRSIGRHYKWLSENTSLLKDLMRNRLYHGKDLRDKPFPLPSIVGPHGFELQPQCWRRSKTKVDRIKTSVNGLSVEGQMYRTTWNPLPDLGTMWIHFVESIETMKTNLSFTEEVTKNFISIFDNYLTDANGLRHLPEHHTRAFIETMQYFETEGWPLEKWANSMGMNLPSRTISSSDINPKSCFLSA